MIRRLAILVVVLGAIWAAPAQASTWCGSASTTDRTQQLFGGGQVHVVYAIPSDGTDRMTTLANAIQTDAENIDVWWKGQDPTRSPRFDLTSFPCGAQLDLTTVRLTQTGAALAVSPNGAFSSIANDLEGMQLLTQSLDPLVYYDGPVTAANSDVCGVGGRGGDGTGIAVLLVNACIGAKTDWIAAHELAHTFGAVDVGAPHRCTSPPSGHTCDNEHDLMFPFTSGDPLANAILDPGRDDYYGHSGTWIDIQDSPYLKRLDSQQHLAVAFAGGAGHVVSEAPGVDCVAACGVDYDGGTPISLLATPGKGLRFLRWSGDCTGAAACSLTLDAAKSVTANFVVAKFKVSAAVTGKGAVKSSPAGIACKPRCSALFTSFKPVKLTAKPTKGWHFKAWSGACRGKKLLCTLPLTKAASAKAVFAKNVKK